MNEDNLIPQSSLLLRHFQGNYCTCHVTEMHKSLKHAKYHCNTYTDPVPRVYELHDITYRQCLRPTPPLGGRTHHWLLVIVGNLHLYTLPHGQGWFHAVRITIHYLKAS